MSVKVLYNDLRTTPIELRRIVVGWHPGLSADTALQHALGATDAQSVIDDLAHNNPEVMVSWLNEATGDTSEMGGVGSLDWRIDNQSILVVTYENETTSESAIDEAIAWMLQDEQEPW
jgi:hypothetical protein